MWLSAGYELHAKEAVPWHVVICQVCVPCWGSCPLACGYLLGMSSMPKKLSPGMWLSAGYIWAPSWGRCPQHVAICWVWATWWGCPPMWLSAEYVCHVEEAVLLYKECLQAELEVHRAEAVRPEEERQTWTKKVLNRKAYMPGYNRDKVNQQGFTEMKPK